jgi:isopentenyl diphosphate isomerase/L-lactate dehydrogenase-like FMN-dependent dehydrogenase
LTAELVRRAKDSGAKALVLTGDTPLVGWKRRPGSEFSIPEEWIMPGLSTPDGMPVRDLSPGNFQDVSTTFQAVE